MWTREKLLALSDNELWAVYEEAYKTRDLIDQLMAQRENHSIGKNERDGGLHLDSYFGGKLRACIHSELARSRAVEATKRGYPAFVGVEPLLIARLGIGYAKKYESTLQAGYVLTAVMEEMGYKKSGKHGKMPPGSVAQIAALYVRDPNAKESLLKRG